MVRTLENVPNGRAVELDQTAGGASTTAARKRRTMINNETVELLSAAPSCT